MKHKPDASTYLNRIKKLHEAGLTRSPSPNRINNYDYDSINNIEERTRKIIGIINERSRSIGNMLFFVMYDIENNKVRRLVAKYLLRQGCHRIQHSIFLADLSNDIYQKIRNDLAEVQSAYENEDSILVVPISTDYLRSMKVIGKNINVDVITHARNTLFF